MSRSNKVRISVTVKQAKELQRQEVYRKFLHFLRGERDILDRKIKKIQAQQRDARIALKKSVDEQLAAATAKDSGEKKG